MREREGERKEEGEEGGMNGWREGGSEEQGGYSIGVVV